MWQSVTLMFILAVVYVEDVRAFVVCICRTKIPQTPQENLTWFLELDKTHEKLNLHLSKAKIILRDKAFPFISNEQFYFMCSLIALSPLNYVKSVV